MTQADETAPRTLKAPQWEDRDPFDGPELVQLVGVVEDHRGSQVDTTAAAEDTGRGPTAGSNVGRPGVQVYLYTSSASGSAKTNSDTRRLVHLLKAHGAAYRLIDLADETSTAPSDRLAMLNASDCIDTLPQLHVNGKFIGIAEDVQEMEDFGELAKVLAGEELDAIVEATRRAIEQRLMDEREWSEKKKVARKQGFDAGTMLDAQHDPRKETGGDVPPGNGMVGIHASSVVRQLTRRDSKDVTELEYS